MELKKKSTRKRLSDDEIDKIVETQTDDDSAWGKPRSVRRVKAAALTLPSELAGRAAFLAHLHREKNVEKWLARIIKERGKLEEVAFSEAKRAMSPRAGDRLRANSGIGRHAGSNCHKTWLDFRVTSERYNSPNNLASRVELFGIGGQQWRGLNSSLNS